MKIETNKLLSEKKKSLDNAASYKLEKILLNLNICYISVKVAKTKILKLFNN